MIHIQTQYNYKKQPGEKNTGVVNTIPNEAYTIKELLEKYSHGTLPEIGKNPNYIGEDIYEDGYDTLVKPDRDLTDIDDLKKKVEIKKQKLSTKQKQLAESKNSAKNLENKDQDEDKKRDTASEGTKAKQGTQDNPLP